MWDRFHSGEKLLATTINEAMKTLSVEPHRIGSGNLGSSLATFRPQIRILEAFMCLFDRGRGASPTNSDFDVRFRRSLGDYCTCFGTQFNTQLQRQVIRGPR